MSLRLLRSVCPSHRNPDVATYRAVRNQVIKTRLNQYPFKFMDTILYNTQICKTPINFEDSDSPIFVIGAWRSGTTYLHNIISQNPNIIYPTLYSTLSEDSYISGDTYLLNHFQKLIPGGTRGFDNVEMTLTTPIEEEVSIERYGPFSYYNSQ
eukprot:115172_1